MTNTSQEQQSRDPDTAVTKSPKKLGEGACGRVVLGRDLSTGAEVAIKFEPVCSVFVTCSVFFMGRVHGYV